MCRAVTWASWKEAVVALSYTAAEYVFTAQLYKNVYGWISYYWTLE